MDFSNFQATEITKKNIVVLEDKKPNGKERPWRMHKMANEFLAQAYEEIDIKISDRLKGCAATLTFKINSEGKKTLAKAFFCSVRLCPMCTWRKSLKTASHMHQIMQEVSKQDINYQYLFITLTVKNCTGDQLSQSITDVLYGYSQFTKIADVDKVITGWYRGFEVTHDVDPFITEEMYNDPKRHKYWVNNNLDVGDANPNYDMFHPHIHMIACVRKSYFSSRDYINQKQWTSFWRQAMKLNYNPRVDVRKVKGSIVKAVSEAAKYSIKSNDYIIPTDWDLTVNTVRTLDKALRARKFIAYGGMLKEIHKNLHLDKPDEGDLIHIDENKSSEIVEEFEVQTFAWYSGYRQYGHKGLI